MTIPPGLAAAFLDSNYSPLSLQRDAVALRILLALIQHFPLAQLEHAVPTAVQLADDLLDALAKP